jgi:hypothetical protein
METVPRTPSSTPAHERAATERVASERVASERVASERVASERVASDVAAWTQRDLRWEELLEEARRIGRDPRLEHLSDTDLEAGVCDVGAQLAAMTCRWLSFVSEFVVRGIWADQGARTPAQWLSWKAGVAPATAREHVRVALRLRELPAIHEAFGAGRISYSKVRALTRFAVAELEDLLLRWARNATAAELEQIAANFRSKQRGRSAQHRDGTAASYGWTQRMETDDTMLINLRLPIEEGVELRERLERRLYVAASREADPVRAVAAPQEPAEVVYRATPADLVQELLHTVLEADLERAADTSGLDRHTLVVQLPGSALTAEGAAVPVRDAGGRMRAMDPRVLRRLACEAGVVVATTDDHGTPMDLGRRSRRVSAALRRAVHLRDRACTFPGCQTTRNLHAHHVEHWADGGPTDLRNLVLLCAAHHRFVHDRALRIEVAADGRHRFSPPGGPPIPRGVETEADSEGLDLVATGPHPTDALRPAHWDGPGSADHDTILAVLEQEFARLAPDLVTQAA